MDEKQLLFLIEGCIANKRKAQEEIYRLFYQAMYRLCMRYLRSDDLVPEALNAGFLKAFTNIKKYDDAKGSFSTWLSAIIVRSCIDLYRSELRFQGHDDIALTDNTPLLPPDVLDRLYVADLLCYVRALPSASQVVFNLYEVDGYDHGEIATMLNISESTSRWHLSAAKKQLRNMIGTPEDAI